MGHLKNLGFTAILVVLFLGVLFLDQIQNSFSDLMSTVEDDSLSFFDSLSTAHGVVAKGAKVPGSTPDTRAPSAVMDDGIPIGLVVPANFNGRIIFAQNETATSSKYTLVSQVTNIIPINGTAGDAPNGYECEGKCDVVFLIHESDLKKVNLPFTKDVICNLVILHDVNDDGDFDDSDEVLNTIVSNGGTFPGSSKANRGTGTTTPGIVDCGVKGDESGGDKGGGTPPAGFRVRATHVPSFSKFAVGGVVSLSTGGISLFSGGGGSHGSPSSFGTSSFGVSSGGEEGFGGILSDNQQNTFAQTKTINPGQKTTLRFDFTEGGGIGNIEHVALFANIRDGQTKYDSNTYIFYDPLKSPQVTVHDPEGFFSDANFELLQKDATNFVLKFDLTFAKSMQKSDLILESWNLQKWSSLNKIPNAIEVESSGIIQEQPKPTAETFLEDVTNDHVIPVWIKSNAKWWSDNEIDNHGFISGIEYLVNKGIIKVQSTTNDETYIPEMKPWIKNTAGWWADDMISDEEFVSSIEWLISNHVIRLV